MPPLFCRAYMEPACLQVMLGALQAVDAQHFDSIKEGGTGPEAASCGGRLNGFGLEPAIPNTFNFCVWEVTWWKQMNSALCELA